MSAARRSGDWATQIVGYPIIKLEKGRQDELLQFYRQSVVNAFGDVERALIALQQSARREAGGGGGRGADRGARHAACIWHGRWCQRMDTAYPVHGQVPA